MTDPGWRVCCEVDPVGEDAAGPVAADDEVDAPGVGAAAACCVVGEELELFPARMVVMRSPRRLFIPNTSLSRLRILLQVH